MKRWQNKWTVLHRWLPGGDATNPEIVAILAKMREGTYEPPAGWRLLTVTFDTHDLTLLFEREIDEEPYR